MMNSLSENYNMRSCSGEDEEELLQELYLAGILKPGLNIPFEKKIFVNDVKLKSKLDSIKTELPWIERFDIINEQAELAPQLSVELKEQEEFVKSGRSDSIALNEFKRETCFHRQAQLAALEGLSRVKAQGTPTVRPDDYFAEMLKTDEHMQKVRHSLLEKQAGLERSEKVKKMRTERKLAKQKQVESTLRKHKEKRDVMESIKKYRKGMRTDLDFLENKSRNDNPTKNIWTANIDDILHYQQCKSIKLLGLVIKLHHKSYKIISSDWFPVAEPLHLSAPPLGIANPVTLMNCVLKNLRGFLEWLADKIETLMSSFSGKKRYPVGCIHCILQ